MSDSLKVVKIFLASPGDLKNERRIAKSSVDEINSIWAASLGYHVELIGWEDTVSSFGRPQALINRDLEQCEYFVGMMWARWGTPPDTGGPYSSGFEEEFEQTMIRRKTSDRPEMSLFFRKINDDLLRDPGDELKKVLKFRERITNSKKVLYEVFEDESDFAARIRRCISKYLQKLHSEETKSERNETLEPKVDASVADASKEPLLSAQASSFLKKIIDYGAQAGAEKLSSADIARFRLRSSVLKKPENDNRILGAHDANLLFVERNNIDFDTLEIQSLIECGFVNCESQNVPIWYWLSRWGGFEHNRLPLHSLFGSVTKRGGVLITMNLMGQSIGSTEDFPRQRIIRKWLGENNDASIKQKALKYLARWGIEADLGDVQAELDREDYQTRKQATEAIISISLRDSREKALQVLFELQPDTVDPSLVENIFSTSEGLDSHLLVAGLSHRNSVVRRRSMYALIERKELGIDQAERLISDSEPSIRFAALKSLIAQGRSFSDNEANSILIKPRANLVAYPVVSDGDTYFAEFVEMQLSNLPTKKLAELAASSSIYHSQPYFALVRADFAAHGKGLRQAIEDEFQKHFDDKLERLSSIVGVESDSVTKTRELSDYLRRQLTRSGLNIICERQDSADLALVRRALKKGLIPYSDSDLNFLRKFGEWSDIAIIIEAVGKVSFGSLLSDLDSDRFSKAANVIYHLGRKRLAEVMALPLTYQLSTALISAIPLAAFRTLDDTIIQKLLVSDIDQVRKLTALKCVKCVSKSRLKRILAQYMNLDSKRYYNVIHWLDLGCSMPTATAARAAEIAWTDSV